MVTTVTTTTTSAITTLTAASLALIALLTLLALLFQKEVASGLKGRYARRLSRALNIAIVPLIIAFASTVVVRIVAVLRLP